MNYTGKNSPERISTFVFKCGQIELRYWRITTGSLSTEFLVENLFVFVDNQEIFYEDVYFIGSEWGMDKYFCDFQNNSRDYTVKFVRYILCELLKDGILKKEDFGGIEMETVYDLREIPIVPSIDEDGIAHELACRWNNLSESNKNYLYKNSLYRAYKHYVQGNQHHEWNDKVYRLTCNMLNIPYEVDLPFPRWVIDIFEDTFSPSDSTHYIKDIRSEAISVFGSVVRSSYYFEPFERPKCEPECVNTEADPYCGLREYDESGSMFFGTADVYIEFVSNHIVKISSQWLAMEKIKKHSN